MESGLPASPPPCCNPLSWVSPKAASHKGRGQGVGTLHSIDFPFITGGCWWSMSSIYHEPRALGLSTPVLHCAFSSPSLFNAFRHKLENAINFWPVQLYSSMKKARESYQLPLKHAQMCLFSGHFPNLIILSLEIPKFCFGASLWLKAILNPRESPPKVTRKCLAPCP